MRRNGIAKALAALAALTMTAGAMTGCASAPGAAPGMARSVDDSTAGMAVRARMLRSMQDFGGVNVDVVGGLVLLTGRVASEEARLEAERIAWSAPKVRDVANELQVSDDPRQAFGANDQWISGQVRARLLADGEVRNATINVQTYDGVVYLLGRARTGGEAERAASNASLVPGVSRVVSFIRIDDLAEEPGAPASSVAPSATPATPAAPGSDLLGGPGELRGVQDDLGEQDDVGEPPIEEEDPDLLGGPTRL